MKYLSLLLLFSFFSNASASEPKNDAPPSASTPSEDSKAAARWERHEKIFNKQANKVSSTKPKEYYLSNSNACDQTEIQLIEKLKERKKVLNDWLQNAEQRELTLLNLEQKLQEKIQLLKTLEEKMEKLLALYNDNKASEIKNLVKVYESMKPADAAKIFNELELKDLMAIIHKMKTGKISPILANMNPAKAKIITEEIITADEDIKKFTN
jgi:flagellar motility protein MotE (MotC chaperone)